LIASVCTCGACPLLQDVAAELAAIPAVPHGAVAVHRPRQNSSSGGVAFTVGSSSSSDAPAAARSAAGPPGTPLAAAAAARAARLELGHNLGMSPHRVDAPQLTSFDDVAPERDPDVWPPPTPDPNGSAANSAAAANSGRRGSSGGGSGGNNRVLPWASRGDEQGERGGSGPGKMLFLLQFS
jgi:hypothetical protein